MIRIDRSKILEPDVLASDGGGGKSETKKAEAFYLKLRTALEQRKPKGARNTQATKKKSLTRAKAFKFSAYGDPSVRQALAQLFNQKCAYCESRYAATQPVDVEHWRPKARVDKDEAEKEIDFNYGYYWLAANWDNLLPSCIDCNRPRTQILESDGTERTVGKGNRFPLLAGSKRAIIPEEVQFEQPLLLNPYLDDPDKHLEFLEMGVVRPKLKKQLGKPSEKGKTSIEVYALNRTGLVQDRREVLLLIQQRMYTVLTLLRVLDELPRTEKLAKRKELLVQRREIIEDLLSFELEMLSRFRDQDRPFSLMARQVIDKFIRSLSSNHPESKKTKPSHQAFYE